MSPKVAFVLLTHNKPHQAVRLVNKLNNMFSGPPIAWHHDFGQCDLPLDLIPKCVSLVRPHFQTGWATFSLIDATLSALKLLLERKNPPEWLILVSGADYPLKSADKIAYDLSMSEYDVHISHEKICFNHYERDWQRLCHERYCSIKFRIPFIDRRLKVRARTINIGHPLVTAAFLPFSREFTCFAGGQWFCIRQKAAEYLLEYHLRKPRLANHYRKLDRYIIVPDESYYQTILCNSSDLRISKNNWRYVDWLQNDSYGAGNPHPKTLSIHDLPKLQQSSAHFARKFDLDKDRMILDALDRAF